MKKQIIFSIFFIAASLVNQIGCMNMTDANGMTTNIHAYGEYSQNPNVNGHLEETWIAREPIKGFLNIDWTENVYKVVESSGQNLAYPMNRDTECMGNQCTWKGYAAVIGVSIGAIVGIYYGAPYVRKFTSLLAYKADEYTSFISSQFGNLIKKS